MLYVVYGTNRDRVRGESHKILSALEKKRPNAEVFRLSDEKEALARVSELLESVGLFEHKHVVVLDYVMSFESVRESVVSRAQDIAESEHIFIVLDEKLDAKTKKVLEKCANEVKVFDTKSEKEERFNIFSLADAVARRDRKSAWVALQRALREDMVPEEIHGVVWWQIKTLLLVAHGDTKTLKPFAVSKAQRALPNFSNGDLEKTAHNLITIYHQSRAGGPPLSVALEQFVLAL